MPTYEYACNLCGLHFEKQQNMTDKPVLTCPGCGESVRRQISGGNGFMIKSTGAGRRDAAKSCSLEETGRTCCGATRRCGESPCENQL